MTRQHDETCKANGRYEYRPTCDSGRCTPADSKPVRTRPASLSRTTNKGARKMFDQKKPLQLETVRRAVVLTGGYTCALTPEEESRWCKYITALDIYTDYAVACALTDKARNTDNPALDVAELTRKELLRKRDLFDIGALWYAEEVLKKKSGGPPDFDSMAKSIIAKMTGGSE